MNPKKLAASLSLDLDNKWSYMKTHGDAGWDLLPTYFPTVVPRFLDFLAERELKITVFVVGQDAVVDVNQPYLRSIAEAGHEIGNHSFHHEPWLHLYSPEQLDEELSRAEDALREATGQRPFGFRGPGYSQSPDLIRTLRERGYKYDASTLPTFIGPLARLYYFFSARLTSEQQTERKRLFGTMRDGFRSLRPYRWASPDEALIEIPVTTMPILRTPFHFSYLLYLRTFSKILPLLYLRASLFACRLFGIEPSLLLHPLDFLGKDDEPNLAFFPGMSLNSSDKLALLGQSFDILQESFELISMREHARRLAEKLPKPQTTTNPSAQPVGMR